MSRCLWHRPPGSVTEEHKDNPTLSTTQDAASSLPGQGTVILCYRDSKRYRNRKSRKETERVGEREWKKIDEKGQKQRD